MDQGDYRAKWLSWVGMWLDAAGRQVDRINKAEYEEMQADVLLFVQAVNNLRRGARAILGDGHPDLEDFDKSWPGLVKLRDMLEHFDEYAAGRGRRQMNKTMRYDAPFIPMFQKGLGSTEYATITLGDESIEINRAFQAAAALAFAARLAVQP